MLTLLNSIPLLVSLIRIAWICSLLHHVTPFAFRIQRSRWCDPRQRSCASNRQDFSLSACRPKKSLMMLSSLTDTFLTADHMFGNTTNKESTLQSVYLLSLQYPPEDDPLTFSKVIKDTWKWKDTVLGDGRDFFVPKPRTLRALNMFLLESTYSNDNHDSGTCDTLIQSMPDPVPVLDECVVLSNCARFDILVVSRVENPVEMIAKSLIKQQHAYQQHHSFSFNPLQSWMDSPDLIVFHDSVQSQLSDDDEELASELARHFVQIRGVPAVAEYLCTVAAGVAMHPRRPHRRVVFQPFSSRDAHILLQLKRTLETAVSTGPTALRIRLMITYALQAGKAARTPTRVPELELLRKAGQGNSKYDTAASPELAHQVAQVRCT
jgi:hypothetical protein